MIVQLFDTREFVSQDIFDLWGDSHIWFVKRQLIVIAAWIKFKTLSTVTINDWCFGGTRNFSGFRPFDCKIGSEYSQHKLGNAIDVVVKGFTAEQIRNIIRDDWKESYKMNDKEINRIRNFGLTTIEKDTPDWVHCDLRWWGDSNDDLKEVTFKP